MKYTITQSRLLYVLSINDRKHQNLLKVGEVFVDNEIADNSNTQVLSKAVRDVLDKRTYMQGVTYNIEFVECTTYNQQTKCYKADDVHRTLRKMGVVSDPLIKKEDADIWFHASLMEVQAAIAEIKAGRGAGYGAIQFRPEQNKAIEETVKYFKKPNGKTFLWNAKMRFGKTLSGLEVARKMGYKSTLIITHRPVVDDGWSKDFEKIFKTEKALKKYKEQGLEPAYGRRMMEDKDSHGNFYTLTKDVDAGKKILVFFVSMQYLRLSQFVGGKEKHFDPLKRAIMEYDWDFVMVDEAHEGIEAAAGVRVMEKLKKEETRILSLSGTPFNLLDKYDDGEIYTWDYVMEQTEKEKWDDLHYGDPNPYADLPRMKILTFTLDKMTRDEAVENNEIFKFHEFFRVWTEADRQSMQKLIDNENEPHRIQELQAQLAKVQIDKFIHEDDVRAFVKKLRTKSDRSQYPFSTKEFRDNFNHTFWLLPGVKEAAALEQMLREDKVFGNPDEFYIVNAAGDGNIEDRDGSALSEVVDNIRGYNPNEDKDRERAKKKKAVTAKKRTITLSCGKLTTGVSVPEWTAVLCMKGSENTPAANYMQTIFRVQTSATLKGRQKSDCYVFDFAPDRALTAVAETAKMAVYAQGEKGKKQLKLSQKKEEEHLEAFIKLCPVLSMDEGEMGKPFSATKIFEKLSNVYIERAVRSGYADNSLYNPERLMNLTPEQEKALGDVHELLGSMPNAWKPDNITINHQGLGDTKTADQIKYIYYLNNEKTAPASPSMSAETDDNGCPMTDEENWSDVMCAPSEMFPYLYVSHSNLIEGTWTNFSQPVLWKEWVDPESKKDEAKKKREEENKEKRARMSVLRGVSIRIPLLVYGAEILLEYDDLSEKDSEEFKKWAQKKNIDVTDKSKLTQKEIDDILDWLVDVKLSPDYFTGLIDDASWEEFMPKGFTKETFNILKDCFDRSIFTGAAKRIRQMVKEADDLNTEDRINKIATIFSYFHNPDKETVLTPWRVVNMHMSDCLGGWCFFNEEFDDNYTIENQYGEEINAARPVGIKLDENGKVVFEKGVTKDVFGDYNARILEINSKTGLYPLYMAYSLFKSVKEPEWRNMDLTGERGKSRDAEQYYHQAGNDLLIWRDVLQDNIFVVCRTKMAVSITKRTLAGFRKDIRMNVKCYEKTLTVNDLVKAGVVKDDVTKKGNDYLYKGKKLVKADDLISDGVISERETTLVGKKHFYNGEENVLVNALVSEGRLTLTLTQANGTYYYNGKDKLECDMINVLRAKPELFLQDIVQGNNFWNVYNSIPKSKNEDINNMKFTAIVGNPPYQENISESAENKSLSKQLFPIFIKNSIEINSKYLSLITPSRWFKGDAQDKSFLNLREFIRTANHIKCIFNYPKNEDVFKNVVIKGGVSYFLYDPQYNGNVYFYNCRDGKKDEQIRPLFEEDLDIILGDGSEYAMIQKVTSGNFVSLTTITTGRNAFGIIGKKEVIDEVTHDLPFDGDIKLRCKGNEIRYTNRRNITKSSDILDKYKVFISKSAGDPAKDSKVIGYPYVGEPGEACTDSLIPVGSFKTRREAENLQKYMKTKFLRYMVSILKVSQNVTQIVYRFVPMQDFTDNSDIDWKKDIDEISRQLCLKYNLSEEDISIIEASISSIE